MKSSQVVIRPLLPKRDLDSVTAFYTAAPDYWIMAEGRAPDAAKAAAFFTDGPPGCDPALSHRLGLFYRKRLSGLAELSFGFPNANDAYLGFMMLGPWARNLGFGQQFLAHVERLALEAGADDLYLAVLSVNTGGRAFWEREGFRPTGLSGANVVDGVGLELHRLRKAL